jgi:hypothetical protein
MASSPRQYLNATSMLIDDFAHDPAGQVRRQQLLKARLKSSHISFSSSAERISNLSMSGSLLIRMREW